MHGAMARRRTDELAVGVDVLDGALPIGGEDLGGQLAPQRGEGLVGIGPARTHREAMRPRPSRGGPRDPNQSARPLGGPPRAAVPRPSLVAGAAHVSVR